MPSAYNQRAEVRQVEPYVYCQSTHGRGSRRFGAARLPWLTGAATWSYHAASAHILGIRPDYAGLRIDPVIPAAWDAFEAIRRFRGARYDIRVRNLDGVQHGVRSIRVDGVDVDPRQPLPVAPAGTKVDVEVYMG